MILPTKHITPNRSLLVLGSDVIAALRRPSTVSHLWHDVIEARKERSLKDIITYDWFILCLDFLYSVEAIEYRDGLLQRASR